MNRIAEVSGSIARASVEETQTGSATRSQSRFVLKDRRPVPRRAAARPRRLTTSRTSYKSMTNERRSGDLLTRDLRRPARRTGNTLERKGRDGPKHKGRGNRDDRDPTGMNQNGDPSQRGVKLKPDGRVDVFSGTVTSARDRARAHADRGGHDGVPSSGSPTGQHEHGFRFRSMYRELRLPLGRSSAATPSVSQLNKHVSGILDIASKELEIAPGDLDNRGRRVVCQGSPGPEDRDPGSGRPPQPELRRADHRDRCGAGSRTATSATRTARWRNRCRNSAISYARLRGPKVRSTTKRRRSNCRTR